MAATANLEAALHALRSEASVRVMWIDAVCINQVDTAEKNIQVPLMGRSYSGVSGVVAWFGPSTPEIELALSWIQCIKILAEVGCLGYFVEQSQATKDLAILSAL